MTRKICSLLKHGPLFLEGRNIKLMTVLSVLEMQYSSGFSCYFSIGQNFRYILILRTSKVAKMMTVTLAQAQIARVGEGALL